MILEKPSSLEISSSMAEIKSTISEASLPFIFKLLSENFYSNPLGSLIREYTSNCIDSHKEAEVEIPVLVRREFDAEERCWFMIFEDFGMGLSTDRILNVFMDYGNSSKRASNDFVGGFGLGSKSGLSYQDSFTIITRYEGIEYEYIYSKGDDRPSIISIYGYDTTVETSTYYNEELGMDVEAEIEIHIPIGVPTELDNGTQIKIQIKAEDNYNLEKSIQKQLCYFNNIEFKGFTDLSNDYTIYDRRTFYYRPDTKYDSGRLHIALGQVAYPLNFNTLGIDEIFVDVALKFDIGKLQVTPNREQLIYNKTTINLIKDAIEDFKRELKELADMDAGVEDMDKFIVVCNNDIINVRLSKDLPISIPVKRKYLTGFRYVFTPVPEIRHINRYIYSIFYKHAFTINDSTTHTVYGTGRAESYREAGTGCQELIMEEHDTIDLDNKYIIAYLREQGLARRNLYIYRKITKKQHKDTLHNNVCRMLNIDMPKRHYGNDYRQLIEVQKNNKIVAKFIAYFYTLMKTKGSYLRDHLPSVEWIEDYKERTRIIRVKKPVIPIEQVTFNYVNINGTNYSSNDTSQMTYGEIMKFTHVIYCIHSTSTNTSEIKMMNKLVRFMSERMYNKNSTRKQAYVSPKVKFISISMTNLEALESKGMTENFTYYTDVFQLDFYKRLPQKMHLIREFVNMSATVKSFYTALSPYGQEFLDVKVKLNDYIGNVGWNTTSSALDIDLEWFNLPYILKPDPFIIEITRKAKKILENAQSRSVYSIISNHSYRPNRVTASLLLFSQIRGLHEKYYSSKHLKTFLD